MTSIDLDSLVESLIQIGSGDEASNESCFAARAGHQLTADVATGRKSPDSPDINLPPGTHKITFKTSDGAAQTTEFTVAADETWGMLVGPDRIAIPVRIY
jgi:hypothetical protein